MNQDPELDDQEDSAILSRIIPSALLHAISPSEWKRRQPQLLEEAKSKPTLFLFDQDLGNGDVTGGMEIIRNILSSDESEHRLCGLITHTVLPDEQFERWSSLSDAFGVSKDKFLVIPKLHLSTNPEHFCYCLKLVALSPHFSKLKSTASHVIAKSQKEASDRIDSINIFDLEYMVFRSGINEGHWEPDVLFRLHSLFQRIAARNHSKEHDTLEQSAETLRRLSGIHLNSDPRMLKNTWEIQRQELYEDSEYLNQSHSPIELGDIFCKGENKRFVLIGQPCDLMLRPNGKREPEMEFAVLAELKKGASIKSTQFDFPFYGFGFEEPWHVNLKRIELVKVCILDLCCFNANGIAGIDLMAQAGSRLRPSLSQRYERLQTQLKNLMRKVDEFSPVQNDPNPTQALKNRLRSVRRTRNSDH